jgi:hypothetical protein
MKQKKEFSTERTEVYSSRTYEGLNLKPVPGFTEGKKYTITGETFDPHHVIGVLYTLKDDNGHTRKINSKYFQTPEPVLSGDFIEKEYVKDVELEFKNEDLDYDMLARTEKIIMDEAVKQPMPVLRTTKKKTKKKKEDGFQKLHYRSLEDLVKDEPADDLTEMMALAGIKHPKKPNSLQIITETINSLKKQMTNMVHQLHDLDKEIDRLKRFNVAT